MHARPPTLRTEDEVSELDDLRREMQLDSLGDRPPSMSVEKLRRLVQLERQEIEENTSASVRYCWVCRSSHVLEARFCPALEGIY